MFGKLTLDYLPHDPIIIGAASLMGVVTIVTIILLTYLKKWAWLWKEWLTTVDHKKIGTMYILVAVLMLFRGLADALLMRSQLVLTAYGIDLVDADHFAQLFTGHGVIMIFFVAMPLMFGLFNWVVPLQIGARDVAFPYLNALSFWLFVAGAMLVNISLIIGTFATSGWLAYPPLSGSFYSPGVGMDYYIWAIQISGVGSLLSGVNFFATITKMRAKGLTMMKLPIFTWSVYFTCVLIMMAFPVLSVVMGTLALDRFFDTNFYTTALGGNAMLYINLIWVWGHPEVYILVLPAFGILSEVAATFSRKRLFGYTSMVWALGIITLLSAMVWVHHFFTMGSGAKVNAVFGIATMIISIPTGVKVFNWLATMYRGKINFSTPMLWLVGFLLTFTLGGMTGVMLAIPAADFQYHNSLFLVAHFHNTIIGGVIFGYFAGLYYWFPKIFGFKLHEGLGRLAFYLWTSGVFVALAPVYMLGIMGATRRLYTYSNSDWILYFFIAAVGTLMIAGAIGLQVLQILWSIYKRKELACSNDPWNARTLEWSIPSPAPAYNFALEPTVEKIDDFWYKKQNNALLSTASIKPRYEDIHMPKNTKIPLLIGILSLVFGFAFVFHINWAIIATFAIMIILLLIRSFDPDKDYYIKAAEVQSTEEKFNKGVYHE
ncbi:Cytochrome o ubiquinol oxidase subunit I [Candidatus Hepatincolaceae symbiont of Richtersius coronifer]